MLTKHLGPVHLIDGVGGIALANILGAGL